MKLHFILIKMVLCFICTLFCVQITAQITVGSEVSPAKGSLLDLKENDGTNENSKKGMLFPRVALEDAVKLDPCIKSDVVQDADKKTHIGLTVYNITDDLTVGLCPGLHVWDGDKWVRVPEPCKADKSLLYSPNCYIVTPGQASEEIPIAKAYLVAEDRSDLSDLSRNDKVFVRVLWQDEQSLIDKVELVDGDKGIFSKFKVTANSGKEGNALVTLHVGPNGDKNDPIVWSWHIWVTDYDPNSVTVTDYGQNTAGTSSVYKYNNGETDYIFMDRNIGGLNTSSSDINSMGLMYQWGRKDPFASANGNWTDNERTLYSHPDNTPLTELNEVLPGGALQASGNGIKHQMPPVASAGSSNLKLAIQNPMTFYYGSYIKDDSDYLFDWYSGDATGTVKDELWGTASQKSPFDPCPAGWRVPAYNGTNSPWYPYVDPNNWSWDGTEGLSTINTKGFNFSGNVSRTPLGYYPAGFSRAPKAYFGGGPVGADDNYPQFAGGTFFVGGGYGTVNGWDLIDAHYWTSTISTTSNAKMMTISITGMMGEPESIEESSPKATGAFVRCVKE